MSALYAEARRSAIAGHRAVTGEPRQGIIPGLYGLKMGGWVPWDEDLTVRLARVDAFFGATA